MPVMVFYKAKSVPLEAAESIMQSLGEVTAARLDAKIEVRVVEPVASYNANEVHIEVRFRDFKEWTDEQLADYHAAVMKAIGDALKVSDVHCSYSFYIIPSMPPRSLWAQDKS